MKIIVKVHTPHITSGFFVAGSITTIMWKESLDIGYIMCELTLFMVDFSGKDMVNMAIIYEYPWYWFQNLDR